MDARETTKQVTLEVGGKTMVFEIEKMDALHGAGLMKFAAQKILPILGMAENAADSLKEKARNLADQEPDKAKTTEEEAEELKKLSENGTKEVLVLIGDALEKISDEELIAFMKRCLRTVKYHYSAGWRAVIVGENFGVPEVEYDLGACLMLCYHVLEVNLANFFHGKILDSLKKFLSTPQSTAQM